MLAGDALLRDFGDAAQIDLSQPPVAQKKRSKMPCSSVRRSGFHKLTSRYQSPALCSRSIAQGGETTAVDQPAQDAAEVQGSCDQRRECVARVTERAARAPPCDARRMKEYGLAGSDLCLASRNGLLKVELHGDLTWLWLCTRSTLDGCCGLQGRRR